MEENREFCLFCYLSLGFFPSQGSHLTLALPQNVYLMTLEPWRENSYLVRFEHLLEKKEDMDSYSKPVTFDLLDVFGKLFDIAAVRETNLAGNQWLTDVKRFKFTAQDEVVDGKEETSTGAASASGKELPLDDSLKFSVTLQPMQIRSFVISTRPQI